MPDKSSKDIEGNKKTDAKKIVLKSSHRKFYQKLSINAAIGAFILAISLLIGMFGYHHFEKLDWIDAYANAAMILSGMGPLAPLTSEGGKIFAGTYALFSGIVFLIVMAIILAPVVHRFLHKFHMEYNDE